MEEILNEDEKKSNQNENSSIPANLHEMPKNNEVSDKELEENYELVDEKYIALDLRKIHSTLVGEDPNKPIKSLSSIHFIVFLEYAKL